MLWVNEQAYLDVVVFMCDVSFIDAFVLLQYGVCFLHGEEVDYDFWGSL